jgi:hypothetical protein
MSTDYRRKISQFQSVDCAMTHVRATRRTQARGSEVRGGRYSIHGDGLESGDSLRRAHFARDIEVVVEMTLAADGIRSSSRASSETSGAAAL